MPSVKREFGAVSDKIKKEKPYPLSQKKKKDMVWYLQYNKAIILL